jgi:hypothetical protein
MPAILRNSLPKLFPSMCNIGSYASIDVVGVRRVRSPPCRISWAEPESANIIGCRTDRPSGPPPIVSTMVSIVLSILSRFFGSFGLIVADGNGW